MSDTKAKSNAVGRRDFLKTAAAATAGFWIVQPGSVYGAPANSKIEMGLIGCGERGTWLGGLFQQFAPAKIVAVDDYFKDRVDHAGSVLGVDPSRRHIGFNGYKEVLAGKVDGVAVISPPYFHPIQAVAALEAGKHVYLAKPIAVDVGGAQSLVAAAAKVKGKQTMWVDFQTRANPFYQGAAQRVHQGMLGEPVMGHVYYHGGRLWPRAKVGTPGAHLRNWVFDIALSGDIIVEQFIHVLDVTDWFLQSHPIKARGTGGRKARVDVGNCWDHFIVTYWYPNDVQVDFSGTQFDIGFSDLCCRIYGVTGTVDSHYGGNVHIWAKHGGYRGGSTRTIYRDGAITNIKTFCQSLQSGKYIQNAEPSAISTMTSILGRMAGYSDGTVTWDEMIQKNEKLKPDLSGLPVGGM